MLIGRDRETAAIEDLLAQARERRSGVLVVRGEAGVGKSALLEHALEGADGFTVLRGVGVEVESELAYAALHQILRPVFDRIEHLPAPQAAALRAAFALSAEQVDERFRVSLGALGLISEVAEERPVLCLVDDAQWLDQASADALVFVARRLEAEAVALLFAARDDDHHPFVAPGLPELRPSSLGPVDSRALLTERLGSGVATGVLDWVVENANGNPLALVELPSNLTPDQLTGHDSLAGRLPPATSVEQVYIERIDQLPSSVRMLLVVAAAEETGERAVVQRAGEELGLEVGDLAAAESAGLLRVHAEHVEFRHPLVRSAAYRGAGFADRERAHTALAAALDAPGDVDRRAWHRAAATIGTDEDVADELERSAERAVLRSGWSAAAAALSRAAELSADGSPKERRLVWAAVSAWRAGRTERAAALLDRASPEVEDTRLRAELEHLRGLIGLRRGVLLDACDVLMAGAEAVAPLDTRKALEMLYDAANAGVDGGDYTRVAEACRRAAAVPQGDDEQERLLGDLLVGVGSLIEGKTADAVPRVTKILERADEFDASRWFAWAGIGAGAVGDDAREIALFRRAADLARASGDIDALTWVLASISVEGIVAGRWAVAGEAAEGLKLAREAGFVNLTSAYLGVHAWFAAVRGRDEDCLAYAKEAVELARANGVAIGDSLAEWGLALLDLGRGRWEDSIARVEALRAAPLGVVHPYVVLTSAPDLVEAYVRAGRGDAAEAAFAPLGGYAVSGSPSWALALAARSRALLADGDEAEAEFADAVRLHAEGGRPYDQARTHLVYGEFLRRRRRRSDAREQLRAAFEGFEALGAEPWAERARAELRATGETARKRDPSTIDQLTPQELQIAGLVAEGNSNKEVAAQLFLSPRTVDYHLRKVFAKLGIASRAELIRHGVGGTLEPAVA